MLYLLCTKDDITSPVLAISKDFLSVASTPDNVSSMGLIGLGSSRLELSILGGIDKGSGFFGVIILDMGNLLHRYFPL